MSYKERYHERDMDHRKQLHRPLTNYTKFMEGYIYSVHVSNKEI